MNKDLRKDSSKQRSVGTGSEGPTLARTQLPPSGTHATARAAFEITETEIAVLHAETSHCFSTIRKWAAGGVVERTTLVRLERAWAKRGFEKRFKADKPVAPTPRRRIVETAA